MDPAQLVNHLLPANPGDYTEYRTVIPYEAPNLVFVVEVKYLGYYQENTDIRPLGYFDNTADGRNKAELAAKELNNRLHKN